MLTLFWVPCMPGSLGMAGSVSETPFKFAKRAIVQELAKEMVGLSDQKEWVGKNFSYIL